MIATKRRWQELILEYTSSPRKKSTDKELKKTWRDYLVNDQPRTPKENISENVDFIAYGAA